MLRRDRRKKNRIKRVAVRNAFIYAFISNPRSMCELLLNWGFFVYFKSTLNVRTFTKLVFLCLFQTHAQCANLC